MPSLHSQLVSSMQSAHLHQTAFGHAGPGKFAQLVSRFEVLDGTSPKITNGTRTSTSDASSKPGVKKAYYSSELMKVQRQRRQSRGNGVAWPPARPSMDQSSSRTRSTSPFTHEASKPPTSDRSSKTLMPYSCQNSVAERRKIFERGQENQAGKVLPPLLDALF